MIKSVDTLDVIKTIKVFYRFNEGDEATTNLILGIGAELLNVSEDTMLELIKTL